MNDNISIYDPYTNKEFLKVIRDKCVTLELVKFKKGDVIIEQGKPSNFGFLHYSGMVKIVANYETDDPTILSFSNTRGLIGLPSVMLRRTYSVSSIALDDVQGCFVSSEELKRLSTEGIIGDDLVNKLTNDILLLQQRITSMTAKNSSKRLMSVVDFLVTTYGVDAIGRVNLKISVKELAELVCISRETTHRILKKLEQDNILRIRNKHLYITKYSRLL